MPEYIDRERLKQSIHSSDLTNREKTALLLCVSSAPAADVEPVIHAHWEQKFNEKGRSDGWICTAPGCGVRSCCKGNYCPNCGAKMDEEAG